MVVMMMIILESVCANEKDVNASVQGLCAIIKAGRSQGREEGAAYSAHSRHRQHPFIHYHQPLANKL